MNGIIVEGSLQWLSMMWNNAVQPRTGWPSEVYNDNGAKLDMEAAKGPMPKKYCFFVFVIYGS